MVIIPTEKQFDWRHTPVVLLSIVFLNIVIFFVYQAGDVDKSLEVLRVYKQYEFVQQEWPAYKDYLLIQDKKKRLQSLERRYERGIDDAFLFEVLTDTRFFHYLLLNGRRIFNQSYYEQWRDVREPINQQILSLSWLSGGLQGDDIRIVHLLTHQFLHGDILHLLGNLFFLSVCGFAVEAAIGHWRFLAFYLVCGSLSGVLQVLIFPDSGVLIGASGAISGVMAMYLGLFRLKRIEFFYWIFFFVGYFRAPALCILPAYVFKELVLGVSDTGSNVAFLAHIVGFVCGGAMTVAMLYFYPRTVNSDYVDQDQSVDSRQLGLADIYSAIENCQFVTAKNRTESMINKFGLDFELAELKYNLLRLNHDPACLEAAADLMSFSKLSPNQLRQVESVWQQIKDKDLGFSQEKKLNIGLRLIHHPNISAARDIFDELYNAGFAHPLMGVFAQKLSQAFEPSQYDSRKMDYKSIAKQLLEDGR